MAFLFCWDRIEVRKLFIYLVFMNFSSRMSPKAARKTPIGLTEIDVINVCANQKSLLIVCLSYWYELLYHLVASQVFDNRFTKFQLTIMFIC